MPGEQRIIFSSNYGDPRGREFDLWAIDVAGTRLERITAAPGFDGFPMFSPDGKRLAFSSNRATAPGRARHQRLRRRLEAERRAGDGRRAERAADRIAAPTFAGWPIPRARGAASAPPGLEASGAYIEERLRALGLQPAGDGGGLPAGVPGAHRHEGRAGDGAAARRRRCAARRVRAGRASRRQGKARARWCSPATACVDKDLGIDDYAGLDVRGKIVVVRRFVPEHAGAGDARAPAARRRSAPQGVAGARARRARRCSSSTCRRRPTDAPAGLEAARRGAAAAARARGLRRRRHPGAGRQARGAGAASMRAAGEEAARVARERRGRARRYTTQAGVQRGRAAAPPAPRATATGCRRRRRRRALRSPGPRRAPLAGARQPRAAPGRRRQRVGHRDVLEVARAARRRRRDRLARDVVFVAFSGEEEGDARARRTSRARRRAGLARSPTCAR